MNKYLLVKVNVNFIILSEVRDEVDLYYYTNEILILLGFHLLNWFVFFFKLTCRYAYLERWILFLHNSYAIECFIITYTVSNE